MLVACALSQSEREGAKDYPAPLFIWAENDRFYFSIFLHL